MAIKQAVTTVFKGRDEQSKAFNRIGKSADKFGEKGSRAFKKVSKSATSAGTIMKGVLGAGLLQKAIGGLSQGLSTVTRQFIQFDDAIVASSAKFKGLDITTKEGIKTLAELKKTAREVGATTKFNAVEAAQGLDFYATAGFNAAQAMAVLKPTAKLATVANLDLARTSDIASDSLGAFGLMTKDSAKLQSNFTRLSDVMAKTLTSTNVNMEDMFEAVKKGAPTFTSTGQSLETFNALMGIMANSGVKGAEAGTQLRNTMLRLAKPTKEAQAELDQLGIKTRDGKGDFRDIVDILGDFEKGLVGMGSAQKAAALKTIFGVRSITGLNLLLQEGSGNIRKFRGQLETAGGTTQKMADIMDKSLGNRLKGLGSAATELGFKFLSAFKNQGVSAIKKLTEIIRKFDPTSLINTIKSSIQFFQDTGIFATSLKTIELTIKAFKTLSGLVSAEMGTIKPVVTFLTGELNKLLGLADKALDLFDKKKGPEGGPRTIGKIFEELATTEKQGFEIAFPEAFAKLKASGRRTDIGFAGFLLPSPAEHKKRMTEREENLNAAFGEIQRQEPGRQAPPQQEVGFNGTLNINGAPTGSTFEQEPGATAVNVAGLE